MCKNKVSISCRLCLLYVGNNCGKFLFNFRINVVFTYYKEIGEKLVASLI